MRAALKSNKVELTLVKYARKIKVILTRSEKETFGLQLHPQHSPQVASIEVDSVLDLQNGASCESGQLEQIVHEGMVVRSINGNSDPKAFDELLSSETTVVLEIERFHPDFPVS